MNTNKIISLLILDVINIDTKEEGFIVFARYGRKKKDIIGFPLKFANRETAVNMCDALKCVIGIPKDDLKHNPDALRVMEEFKSLAVNFIKKDVQP